MRAGGAREHDHRVAAHGGLEGLVAVIGKYPMDVFELGPDLLDAHGTAVIDGTRRPHGRLLSVLATPAKVAVLLEQGEVARALVGGIGAERGNGEAEQGE